ncbi:Alpha/Beta hydrolase protein [Thamnocephalis sphaerospora]|uniref:Alpha/Beta hydrolase protein n=1 Tax=Thamnocephalis sphaerospora TaxID=78915 RepID=A0A4P9XSL0_9FUNG|nr:Alpha/Beta hydrolase protein [Thamnocephalis sphaerospora]|eukprot:RKP09108.1 Alpha/Beta hydrolase protein [Thamnocephalis sphaerospora]
MTPTPTIGEGIHPPEAEPTEHASQFPPEQWLQHRVRKALPADAQTQQMRAYAEGLSTLQLASCGKAPLPVPKPSLWSVWLPWSLDRLLQQMGLMTHANNVSLTPTESDATTHAGAALTCAPDQEDDDLMVVAYTPTTDSDLATVAWAWPWPRKNVQRPSTPPKGWQLVAEDAIVAAQQWARYAAAAYCLSDDALMHWSCQPHCGNLPSDTHVQKVFSSPMTGARGYVAVREPSPLQLQQQQHEIPNRQVILAFRGTLELRGLAHDLYFAKADQEIPSEYKHLFGELSAAEIVETLAERPRVHSGFYQTTMSVMDTVLIELDKLLGSHQADITTAQQQQQQQQQQLVIVGHSLGGAVAILTALQILHRRPPWLSNVRVCLYTFGEPRVGNAAFTRLVHLALADASFSVTRVTNAGDPVPSLPPNLVQFQHHGHRWLIRRDGSTCCMAHLPDRCAENADAEEGPDMGSWSPLSDPVAHLRAWGVLFGPWCAGVPSI